MFFHCEEVKCLDKRIFAFYFVRTMDLFLLKTYSILIGRSSYSAFHFHFFFPVQQAYNVGTEFQARLIMTLKGKVT